MSDRFITIKANGLEFVALTQGGGDRVALLLHGFPDDAGSMRGLMNLLASRGYRCIAPFMRGYGATSKPSDGDYSLPTLGRDAVALARELGGKETLLLGHDWGALTAYHAAAIAPDVFNKVVTLAVPPPDVIARNLRRSLAQLRRSWYAIYFQLPILPERRIPRNEFAFINRLWRDWSPGWDYPLERIAEVKATLAHPGCVKAALGYYRANVSATGGRMNKISTPTLMISAENDGCIGPEMYAGFESAFSGPAYFHVVEAAGHFMHLEKPEEVGRLILDFIDD